MTGKPSIFSAATAAACFFGLPRSRDACHALCCRRGGGTGSPRWLARHRGTSKKTKAKTINHQQQFDHTLKKKSMMLVSDLLSFSLFIPATASFFFFDPLVFNKAREDDSPSVCRLAGRWAAGLDTTTRGQCYECINFVLRQTLFVFSHSHSLSLSAQCCNVSAVTASPSLGTSLHPHPNILQTPPLPATFRCCHLSCSCTVRSSRSRLHV